MVPETGAASVHSARGRGWRAVEFGLLFFGVPLAFRMGWLPVPMFALLWGMTAIVLAALLRDPSFDRACLWRLGAVKGEGVRILGLFAVGAALIALYTWQAHPERLLGFVQRRPLLWALVIFLYPVLSVYPQGVLYRVFLFHRYAGLFPHPAARIAASAMAFSCLHIVFRNPVAPAFTLVGGLLFAWTYARTRSAAASAFEHALYGDLIFTIGLGWFFYSGAQPG